jgi:peptide/nickel transport system permease protein
MSTPLQHTAKSIASELASLGLTLLGLLLVTFLIARVMPIDPVLALVGDRAPADVYERARLEMGLDRPLWVQFGLYLAKLASGDFGRSVLTSNPVLTDIARVFPATLELATLGTLIGVAIGVPLGVSAAVNPGGYQDQIGRIVGLIGYSVPVFWLGLMGLRVFYRDLDWVSGPGRIGIAFQDFVTPVTGVLLVDTLIARDFDAFKSALSHIILPAAVLGLTSVAYISRMMRSFMITELQQQYIVTARVKGLSERRVIWGHAARNALSPLLAVIALSYAHLLEGSVLTESVFAWPGLGRYITNALLNADMNAVLGGTIIVGCVFIGVNRIADLIARIFDPRVVDQRRT